MFTYGKIISAEFVLMDESSRFFEGSGGYQSPTAISYNNIYTQIFQFPFYED